MVFPLKNEFGRLLNTIVTNQMTFTQNLITNIFVMKMNTLSFRCDYRLLPALFRDNLSSRLVFSVVIV